MGVKSLFNNTADLTGLFNKAEGIYVSDVIQKTVFEIDEEGDEPPRDESEDPASGKYCSHNHDLQFRFISTH